MVKDKQVRELMKILQEGRILKTAALKTGMDEKTAISGAVFAINPILSIPQG